MLRAKYPIFDILMLAVTSIFCTIVGTVGSASTFLVLTSGLFIITVVPIFFPILLPLVSLFYLPVFQTGSLNITITDLFIVSILISSIIYRYFNKNGVKFDKYILVLILGSFTPLIFGFIGHILTFGDLQGAITSSLLYAKRFSMYSILLLAAIFTSKKQTPVFTCILIGCIMIASLSAIFPQINDAILSPELRQSSGKRRVGLLLNPNVAGNYAIMFINFFVALILYGKNIIRFRIITAYSGILLSIGLLLVSGSRGAIFAGITSILFWMWHNYKSKKLFYILLILIMALTISANIFPELSIIERWQRFADQGVGEANVAGRINSQAIALRIFLDNPFFGAGVNSLGSLSQNYGGEILGADSQYVDTLVETGIFGLIAFLSTIYYLFRLGIAKSGVYGTILAVNVLALAVSGFSVFTFYSPFLSIIIWCFAYLAISQSDGR